MSISLHNTYALGMIHLTLPPHCEPSATAFT